jgi:hypothetical protein
MNLQTRIGVVGSQGGCGGSACSSVLTARRSHYHSDRWRFDKLAQEERNGNYREGNHHGYSDHPPGYA